MSHPIDLWSGYPAARNRRSNLFRNLLRNAPGRIAEERSRSYVILPRERLNLISEATYVKRHGGSFALMDDLPHSVFSAQSDRTFG